ncbi:NADH-quinone oxidoreductase subunit NuoE family protein [Athalassotoga saccharophila]|uniref:NADH-quinone oxidoreductase subunit NuoE family protein n=1 Tax=Athalassotoga saccharophila TaxID=1441386 RepID=UPI00137A5CDF|nr:NAD(P)H-dependent oxidoreductase subunit E [Athalassotoga saccharophila]BBJ27951.1 NADP-reducing hydrogenase subunit HndA [Athalassotoga saccharophila]
MENQTLTDPKFAELDEFIDNLPDKKGMLIGVLHKAQEIFGYLPAEVQHHIAQKLDIPESTVFGVVTFYSFFTMKPRGKYQIKVCLGTACYVKGGQKISDRVKEELGVTGDEPTSDGLFSVQEVRCLGACSMAPVMLVGERDFYGRLTPDKIPQIIESYRRKENKK